MSRIFITGSADGLGWMAAELLAKQGHDIVLHARNAARAEDLRQRSAWAQQVVIGDLSSIEEMRSVAEQVNRLGRMSAVIHNAGIGYREPQRIQTVDGIPHVFAVNTLSPYVLTSLIQRPERLIYLSSGLHRGANSNLEDVTWEARKWNGLDAYSETKLHDVLLAFAVARYWPEVLSNALEPGWVKTKMGGPQAPDDLAQAHLTQAWLATSTSASAMVTGRYFYHLLRQETDPAVHDRARQDRLLEICEALSGVTFPR